jgi:hypothetical protein
MRQSLVWKKRPAGLAGDMKGSAKCWLNANEESRQDTAAALPSLRKAGLKKRRN